MGATNILRAMAWFAVAVIFWSLNIRWGSDPNLPGGPPAAWHRAIVGAGLLSFIAALALSVSGRGGNPPSWLARGVATASALGILAITWWIRSDATGPLEDAARGSGWVWLAVGGGVLAAAAFGMLAHPKPAAKAADKPRSSGQSAKKRR